MIKRFFSLFRKSAKTIKTTGHFIDYRQKSWGHNIEVIKIDKETGFGTAWIFHHFGVHVGDIILLPMQSGKTARFPIIEIIDHPLDPGDMYFIKMMFLGYLENDD